MRNVSRAAGNTRVYCDNNDVMRKLSILSAAAKYDASCTSSCSSREGGATGAARPAGVCHTWSADGRCVSLLKILMTNDCIYDCAYCVNRRSSNVERASFTPQEAADLTMAFYKRNYIEGLFLSSSVERNPDDTMAGIVRTLVILRSVHGFGGYIHAKVIPGASRELIEMTGRLADRVSVNIELPTERSLSLLAPQKTAASVFTPMRMISESIAEREADRRLALKRFSTHRPSLRMSARTIMPSVRPSHNSFAPAGQSTQMIVGATPENDLTIMRLAENLYKKMSLKRVFYSAYVPVGASSLPSAPPPLRREHRLYQADWLLRFYGFSADELLNDKRPNLDEDIDPKTSWALDHIDMFPVNANTADYDMLLRTPGIGVKAARRIVAARRERRLNTDNLIRLGVVMKRARHFLECADRPRIRAATLDDLRLILAPHSRQLTINFGGQGTAEG